MTEFIKYLVDNLWGIIGVIVSGVGLLFAFLQLKKIAANTTAIDETYKRTIQELENNESLSNISTAIQKTETIKHKIQDNKIIDLKNDLAQIAKLLVTLKSSLKNKITDLELDSYKQMSKDLEVKIITENEEINKENLKDEYIAFSDLELLLTQIQAEIKYNRN